MRTIQEVNQLIAELQNEKSQILSKERGNVIAEIKQKIIDFNITSSDLGFSNQPETKKSANKKAVVMYKNEEGLTWSGGRGRQPEWVKAIKEVGGDIEKYRV